MKFQFMMLLVVENPLQHNFSPVTKLLFVDWCVHGERYKTNTKVFKYF